MQSSPSEPPDERTDDVPAESAGAEPEVQPELEPEPEAEPEVADEAPAEKASLESALNRWGMPNLGAKQEPVAESVATVERQRPDYLRIADRWLGILGPFALVVFAFVYFQQYYMSGLNLGGEGGTNAVIAMRLLEGQRPIADTFLGYNVMWFYPIVWLFQIFGPDFNAMRVFFYCISTVTGLLAFFTVRRVTSANWLALATGVLVLLLPGMLFRNYMGFLPVLNVFVLLRAFVFESESPGRRMGWYIAAGGALGLTFLIRIDVGVFFTPIYVLAALIWPFAVRRRFWRRLPEAVAALLTVILVAGVLHLPVWLDSRARGFEENFIGQYKGMWGLIQHEAKTQILDKIRPSAVIDGGHDSFVNQTVDDYGNQWIRVQNDGGAGDDSMDELGEGATLARPPIGAIFTSRSLYDAGFVIALYLPVVIAPVIFLVSGIGLLIGVFRVREDVKRDALAAGVTLGGALTLFPQYFFFRPDTPHLAEFMIPFLVAMVCASYLGVRWFWSRPLLRLGVVAFILACVVSEGAFFYHAFYRDSSGSIRVRHKKSQEFVAENGVRAFIRKRDLHWMEGLRDSVLNHSEPQEWVITYPYSPTINFMTNRRSYLRNLYIDDVTAPRDFYEVSVHQIREFRPAVIVVDDRDINKTEHSRFSRWAAPTMEFIRSEYVQVGQFQSISVFARPDRAPKMTDEVVAPTPFGVPGEPLEAIQ